MSIRCRVALSRPCCAGPAGAVDAGTAGRILASPARSCPRAALRRPISPGRTVGLRVLLPAIHCSLQAGQLGSPPRLLLPTLPCRRDGGMLHAHTRPRFDVNGVMLSTTPPVGCCAACDNIRPAISQGNLVMGRTIQEQITQRPLLPNRPDKNRYNQGSIHSV